MQSIPATAITTCRSDEKKQVETVTPRSYTSGGEDGNSFGVGVHLAEIQEGVMITFIRFDQSSGHGMRNRRPILIVCANAA
jgi:hypothetical protein